MYFELLLGSLPVPAVGPVVLPLSWRAQNNQTSIYTVPLAIESNHAIAPHLQIPSQYSVRTNLL